jgi:16S rRNA processing protein RimM
MTPAHPWRPERVRVGTVGRAHGLDGSFRVADPCGWWPFRVGGALLVNGEVRTVAAGKGDALAPVIALEGARDRTAAEALRGSALEIGRDDLPAPDPDAYFRFDLVGCAVAWPDGRELGVVEAVEDGVAHDLLVVGGHRVPFVAAIVPEVDIEGRRMTLDAGYDPVAVE